MSSRSASFPATLVLLLACTLLAAACGGSSTTPTPGSHGAAASTGAGAVPAASPAAAATAAPVAASQLAGAAAALDNLTSYRFSVKVRGTGAAMPSASGQGGTFGMDGTVVLKPQRALSVSMSGMGDGAASGLAVGYTIIGDSAWMQLGGTAMPLPAGQGATIQQTIDAFSPQRVFGQSFDQYLSGMHQVGQEQKNGVATIHLQADAQSLDALARAVGGGTGVPGTWKMDLWVARDGGYMVSAVTSGSYEVNGAPATMLVQIDISGINDPANRVVAPS